MGAYREDRDDTPGGIDYSGNGHRQSTINVAVRGCDLTSLIYQKARGGLSVGPKYARHLSCLVQYIVAGHSTYNLNYCISLPM